MQLYAGRIGGKMISISSTGVTGKSFTYDAAGNVASIGEGEGTPQLHEFDYDALNRLTDEIYRSDHEAQISTLKPLIYWRLDETSGITAYDSSGNGYDGTYKENPTLGVPSLAGDNNLAMRAPVGHLPGQWATQGNGWVEGPTLTGKNVTAVEMLFQSEVTGNNRDLINFYATQSSRFVIFHHDDGRIIVSLYGSGWVIESDNAVTSNEAHHMAVWYEPSTNLTYMMLDGVIQQDTYDGNVFAMTDPNVYLGLVRSTSYFMDRYQGILDEVAIYDKPLTASAFATRPVPSGSSSSTTSTFDYDGNGNRISNDDGVTASTLTYQAQSDQLATIDSGSVQHDLAGNRTADAGSVRTYSYSDSNRLVQILDNGVTTASYSHNAMGQRVKKTVGSTTTVFVYDQLGQLIAEHDESGSLIRDYVRLNGSPVAQIDMGEVFSYLHFDHVNTPRVATSDAQTVIWRWNSDAFGTSLADEDPDGDSTATIVNLRFPGQYFDVESGFHYNYYRTYDPSTGRYLESDPIGLAAGLNTYAYVGNMPTTYVDPFGLDRLPPSYPVSHPDYYNGPKGDFYETTGRPRPPTGPGLSLYGEIGGCLFFGCAETRFFPDPGTAAEPLIAPELVGGGLSFCMEAKPDPNSCESDDQSSRDSLLDLIDETSIGMGKRFGFTVSDINPRENRKLCLNIGLGFGSPISPAHSLGEQPVFDPNQPLPEIP